MDGHGACLNYPNLSVLLPKRLISVLPHSELRVHSLVKTAKSKQKGSGTYTQQNTVRLREGLELEASLHREGGGGAELVHL